MSEKVTIGAFGAWHTKRNVLFELNEVHGDFRRVFFEHFRALLEETNDEAYVCRLADYVRWILSKYMFVRVERPRGSKHFVLGYVKCDWVFSFARRFEQMRLRLNRVPPTLLTKVEVEENKALRLACVGETDYEQHIKQLLVENKNIPCQNKDCPRRTDGGSKENVRHSVVKKWLEEGGKLHCNKCHKKFKCKECKKTESWDQLERWVNPWDESKEWNAWVSNLMCKECCRCPFCGELMNNCKAVTGKYKTDY